MAFAVYVHRIRSYLGAYLVQLGALDAWCSPPASASTTPALRAAVTDDLERFGIALDHGRTGRLHRGPGRLVTGLGDRRTRRPTDEELAIARAAAKVADAIR